MSSEDRIDELRHQTSLGDTNLPKPKSSKSTCELESDERVMESPAKPISQHDRGPGLMRMVGNGAGRHIDEESHAYIERRRRLERRRF